MNSTTTTNRVKRPARTWLALFNLTLFSAYFYAFMEWLFFATKPSSLSILTPSDSGLVLAVTGGIFALLLSGGLIVLSLPAWLASSPTWKARLLTLGYFVPALMLSVTALILLDNFTYTVFKFGIVSTSGVWRAVYALGFAAFLWQALRYVGRTIQKRPKKSASPLALRPRSALLLVGLAQGGALGLLTVSMAAILATCLSHGRPRTQPAKHPDHCHHHRAGKSLDLRGLGGIIQHAGRADLRRLGGWRQPGIGLTLSGLVPGDIGRDHVAGESPKRGHCCNRTFILTLEEPMLTIKILGPGCSNCQKLAYLTERAITHLGIEAQIEKVTNYADIMKYPILSTPGLVINEKLVASGRIPSEVEITTFLANALEAA